MAKEVIGSNNTSGTENTTSDAIPQTKPSNLDLIELISLLDAKKVVEKIIKTAYGKALVDKDLDEQVIIEKEYDRIHLLISDIFAENISYPLDEQAQKDITYIRECLDAEAHPIPEVKVIFNKLLQNKEKENVIVNAEDSLTNTLNQSTHQAAKTWMFTLIDKDYSYAENHRDIESADKVKQIIEDIFSGEGTYATYEQILPSLFIMMREEIYTTQVLRNFINKATDEIFKKGFQQDVNESKEAFSLRLTHKLKKEGEYLSTFNRYVEKQMAKEWILDLIERQYIHIPNKTEQAFLKEFEPAGGTTTDYPADTIRDSTYNEQVQRAQTFVENLMSGAMNYKIDKKDLRYIRNLIDNEIEPAKLMTEEYLIGEKEEVASETLQKRESYLAIFEEKIKEASQKERAPKKIDAQEAERILISILHKNREHVEGDPIESGRFDGLKQAIENVFSGASQKVEQKAIENIKYFIEDKLRTLRLTEKLIREVTEEETYPEEKAFTDDFKSLQTTRLIDLQEEMDTLEQAAELLEQRLKNT